MQTAKLPVILSSPSSQFLSIYMLKNWPNSYFAPNGTL